jgi:hypothetical protein
LRTGGINNKTVTLQPNGSETISVQPGDKWQGVYHFDTLRANNGEAIHSSDPIRLGVNGAISLAGPTAAGQYLELFDTINATDVTVTGNVSVLTINTTNLTVKNGALLTTPNNGTTPNTLTLNVTGTMTVENGGVIDVSGRGYATSVSYPGATVAGSNSGGSHIGVGGLWSTPTGSTFGSIYRPREAGGGNGANGPSGGGIVRINAATLNHDGAIRANGSVNSGSGAGGSVWITATNLNGAGTLDANGGDMQSCCGVTSGGGGAISVEYTNLGAGATVLNKLTAKGGVPNGNNRPGMAGTVYTRNPANTWGDVVIDNKGIGNPQGLTTDFPSLGGGTAQTGSTGATLVTDRTVNIPAYFEGHWVEISSSGGTFKGTWRIATGGINNKTVTLQPNGNETIDVQPGDKWQGVYHFDTLRANNGENIHSSDPIRLGVNGVISLAGPTAAGQYLELFDTISATDVTVTGNVSVLTINTTNLTVKNGALLTTPNNGTTPNTLTLNVTGTMTVENGGVIDVSGRGYATSVSYPGATVAGSNSGGSHIGVGGLWSTPTGSTFGSIYRPREAGGGNGANGPSGGGIVRINAATLNHDGAIRANGSVNSGSGAGGSVWITATNLNGAGTLDANGGDMQPCCGVTSGGGGAISVEYTNLGAGATVLNKLTAKGGLQNGNNRPGAAGSFYVKGPSSTYGDLTVDNKTTATSAQLTELQALGIGIAQTGSSGATLVTDRTTNIPAYFEGHWVNVTDASGTVKGSWRIATGGISSKTVTLQPNGSETISIQPGDHWRGSYKFDHLTLKNDNFQTADLVELGNPVSVTSATYQFGNVSAPAVDTTKISIQPSATGAAVVGTAGAVSDIDQPIIVTAINANTGTTFSATAAPNGSFAVGVQGNANDTIQIKAKDSHLFPLESTPVTVGHLSSATPVPTQIPASTWTSDTQFAPRTVSVDGKTLVVATYPWSNNGTSDKIAIVDISDPARPTLKRMAPTVNRVLDVKAVNGWAYVAGDRFGTINLSDPNATINLTGDPCGRDYSIALSGGYAFTGEVDCNNDGRINIYDVSNPAAPRYLRQQGIAGFGGYSFTHLYALGTDYLVGVSHWGPGRDVMVIDHRNVNNLIKVSELQVPNISAFRAKLVGSKLYFVSFDAAQMVVVDLSNPAVPVVQSTLTLPAGGTGIDIVGNDTFIADLGAGLVTARRSRRRSRSRSNAFIDGISCDGSFTTSLAAASGDAITLTATDSSIRTATCRSAPTLARQPERTIKVEGNNLAMAAFPGESFGTSDKLLLYDITTPARRCSSASSPP